MEIEWNQNKQIFINRIIQRVWQYIIYAIYTKCIIHPNGFDCFVHIRKANWQNCARLQLSYNTIRAQRIHASRSQQIPSTQPHLHRIYERCVNIMCVMCCAPIFFVCWCFSVVVAALCRKSELAHSVIFLRSDSMKCERACDWIGENVNFLTLVTARLLPNFFHVISRWS